LEFDTSSLSQLKENSYSMEALKIGTSNQSVLLECNHAVSGKSFPSGRKKETDRLVAITTFYSVISTAVLTTHELCLFHKEVKSRLYDLAYNLIISSNASKKTKKKPVSSNASPD
jgi:hypothetical protein